MYVNKTKLQNDGVSAEDAVRLEIAAEEAKRFKQIGTGIALLGFFIGLAAVVVATLITRKDDPEFTQAVLGFAVFATVFALVSNL